jgi:hypothetical protein
MLFRPKEVHRASGIRGIFKPLPKRNSHICHQTFGFGSKELPVPDLHLHREPTIETGSIDLDCFPWKEPADC